MLSALDVLGAINQERVEAGVLPMRGPADLHSH